ncbi:MAG: hypothetical protein Q4B73_00255 [Lachnospiraceae bacterium]|nr:hypothetical protein [Lachnospiraceae bacterium]
MFVRKLIRVIVFLAVFLTGVITISGFIGAEEIKTASDLTDPTLPVMCIDLDGMKADRMYGYRELMDAEDQRDALIPVGADRQISVSYKTFGHNIRSVSYEVTAPDTGAVAGNAQIGNFKVDGDYMTATFTLNTAILMNREYPIRFTLKTDQGEIYYYGRLIQRSTNRAVDYVKFVNDFYETCLNKDGASGLNIYLETDESVTTRSFTNVSLKSTFDQVTWGSLKPSILRRAVPTITEINDNTCSITSTYRLSAVNDEGETEVYKVSEFYRLRYTPSRMRVLDFNRSASQIFDPENNSIMTTTGLKLGVASRDVSFVTDESADIVAFVREGSLWLYNDRAQKLTCVFSFRRDNGEGDERFDNDDYDIKVIRVHDNGDIDFVVYGYMSQGHFEGRQGVLVCRYLGQNSVVEERAFIPDTCSYEYLRNDLSRLNTISENGFYYGYIDNAVYKVDLASKSYETVVTGADPECFVSSEDDTVIAWMDEMKPQASTAITVYNVETGESRRIEAAEGTYIKALGFINNDFVYGIAAAADLQKDATGNLVFAMNHLSIEDTAGNEVLTYDKPGIYVSDVSISNGLIEMTRVVKDAQGQYQPTSSDNIMNNQSKAERMVTVSSNSNNRQGRVVTLTMPGTVSNMKPLITTAPHRLDSDSITVKVERFDSPACLYDVYGGGHLVMVTSSPRKAVVAADDNVGVALNREGQYIYERGNTADQNEIANEDIPEIFKSGTMDPATLQEALGENGTVLDLSGCSLQQVLYQVSLGRPVLARHADGGTALIVGYNQYNTRLYNFETGEHYWFGINDSTAEFAAGGNVFVTLITPDKTIRENR